MVIDQYDFIGQYGHSVKLVILLAMVKLFSIFFNLMVLCCLVLALIINCTIFVSVLYFVILLQC